MSIHAVDCLSAELTKDSYFKPVHIENHCYDTNQTKSTFKINDVDLVFIEKSLKLCKKIYKRLKYIFQASQVNSCCRLN